MEDEKIKTGMYIKKECKNNIDKLKFYDVKPNEFFDKILKFDKEGLITYINLVGKFNDFEEGFTLVESNHSIYCTNQKKEFKKAASFDDLSTTDALRILNQNHATNLDMAIENTEKDKLEKLEIILNEQQTYINDLFRAVASIIKKIDK
ncbi:hypothetical protein [Aliarcobacter butzleri]|uniref:hypothetical protein n=1 Tax=Aliarcobacter butzleri TaxID=28197 RepID=UPI0021B4BA42|nr:hypothetical protein [Aliarcobacter butzleri]MCT7536973.1 hypothetical protein [Aliarcobacter butzleri]